eukprot:CAMPEP_0117467358 /NCGR_PEP_ID=MMETSP0784-20121206/5614_1 /TAXON_ID=39447 /ORGANISM="" /LENGTH=278 /DNA_ID=CAMNT_0005261323 /DNA_START=65 /DNA_END=898 /DNA_ORIENTATION=+
MAGRPPVGRDLANSAPDLGAPLHHWAQAVSSTAPPRGVSSALRPRGTIAGFLEHRGETIGPSTQPYRAGAAAIRPRAIIEDFLSQQGKADGSSTRAPRAAVVRRPRTAIASSFEPAAGDEATPRSQAVGPADEKLIEEFESLLKKQAETKEAVKEGKLDQCGCEGQTSEKPATHWDPETLSCTEHAEHDRGMQHLSDAVCALQSGGRRMKLAKVVLEDGYLTLDTKKPLEGNVMLILATKKMPPTGWPQHGDEDSQAQSEGGTAARSSSSSSSSSSSL